MKCQLHYPILMTDCLVYSKERQLFLPNRDRLIPQEQKVQRRKYIFVYCLTIIAVWNTFVGRMRCETYLSRPWFREESKTQHLKILKSKNMKDPNILLPEANRKVILLYVCTAMRCTTLCRTKTQKLSPSLRPLVRYMVWGGFVDNINLTYKLIFFFQNQSN